MLATTRTLSAKARTVTRSANLAMIGVTYFALVIIALHFLRPDYNPIAQPTSDYAVGPYAFLMTTAFFSMSVACWALLIALGQGLPPVARSRAGLILLSVWAVGVVIAMTFPTDLDGAPPTLAGRIHQTNGPLIFFSLAVGAVLISRRFKHAEQWRSIYRLALSLSLLMLAGFVVTGAAIGSGAGFGGLAQRTLLVTFLAWFYLTAARLRATAAEPW
jgi:hypothetical protein